MRYTGINHLAMVTNDMDKTIRFWRDLLGLRLVAGMGKPGYRHYFFELSDTDMIAFFEWPEVENVEEKDHGYPVKGKFIFDHVALGVESEEDLWELKAKLEKAGFWTSEIIDHGFIWSLYSFDPNGIPIEFSYGSGELDIRSKPVMIDRAPGAVALEGPDPQPGKWPSPERSVPESERIKYPGEGRDLLIKQDKNRYS